MLDKLLSPFVGYWYWAQDRGTPLTRIVAMAAPVVTFAVVLYLLFGAGGNGSSFDPLADATRGTSVTGTQAPAPTATPPPAAAQTTSTGPNVVSTAGPAATTAPAPTAFTQMRYTVVAGDNPSIIAEKVGVPAEQRAAWIEELLALNGATATSLQIDQELILPPF